MTLSETTPRHPIRVVAQRTGLTPAAIRAWERRYGAVDPTRSEGGQRLYSDRDVDRLSTLRRLTEAGRSISLVAGLSDEEAAGLLEEDQRAAAAPEASGGSRPSVVVGRAFEQMRDLDGAALEQTLWRAAVSMEGSAFFDDVVTPLLEEVGTGWAAGEVSTAQEHLGSDVIDRVLARLSEPSRVEDGPAIVVATLPGERHGLGARLVASAATVDGWDVTYLGADLPVEDIVATAESVAARVVAISVVSKDLVEEATANLARLREQLGQEVAVIVGGRASQLLDADRLPARVKVLDGLDSLRTLRLNGH